MAKWLHWGNRRKVVGEPPARKTLTDLSSGLLEPQGKPGWGKIGKRRSMEFIVSPKKVVGCRGESRNVEGDSLT